MLISFAMYLFFACCFLVCLFVLTACFWRNKDAYCCTVLTTGGCTGLTGADRRRLNELHWTVHNAKFLSTETLSGPMVSR